MSIAIVRILMVLAAGPLGWLGTWALYSIREWWAAR